jgi:endonuclease YncB( thermonuclease family)
MDVDVALAQIDRGLAWHFKRYKAEQSPEDRVLYARAEQEGRSNRRGMWASSKPQMPPWEFRAGASRTPSNGNGATH